MIDPASQPIGTDFELTAEMLDQWEGELDEFHDRIRQRLALLTLANEPATPTAADRDENDAIRLTQSITDLLS